MATNTGAKYHQEQLHRHCRVCARVVQDREFKYSCKNNTDLLRKSGIHVVNALSASLFPFPRAISHHSSAPLAMTSTQSPSHPTPKHLQW